MAQSSDPADVKKQMEAAAGQAIDIPADQLIKLNWPIGAHDTTDGIVASRGIFVGSKSCSFQTLLDASGSVVTDAGGSTTFLLSNSICLPAVRNLAEPVHLVATVQSAAPFYVTANHAVVAGGTDVQISLFAWDAKGNPAPGTLLNWRCRVVSTLIL